MKRETESRSTKHEKIRDPHKPVSLLAGMMQDSLEGGQWYNQELLGIRKYFIEIVMQNLEVSSSTITYCGARIIKPAVVHYRNVHSAAGAPF